MNQKIQVDPARLEEDINILNNSLQNYLTFWNHINNGLGSMMNALDPVLQRNIGSKMDKAMHTTSACGDTLGAMLRALQNCKDNYEATDQFLAHEYRDWIPESILNEHYPEHGGGGREIEIDRIFGLPNIENVNGTDYGTLNYSNCVMDQTQFDGNEFGYGEYNAGCTSTAWCMGLSILTGKEYDPTSSDMWINGDGASFKGQGGSVWNNQQGMLNEAYNQLLNGKPSVFYARHYTNYGNCMHAVTIVGISKNTNPNSIQMSDFLVVDPWKGNVTTLDTINYYDYSGGTRLITYGDNLP